MTEKVQDKHSTLVDSEHVQHCFYSLLAGSCFSLSLKYAGTFHSKAKATVASMISKVMQLQQSKGIS
jgi:hypothetical protein